MNYTKSVLSAVFCLILCLTLIKPGEVRSEESEFKEELPVLSDTELKTEGAATRKPLSESDMADEMGPQGDTDGLEQDHRTGGKQEKPAGDNSGTKHALSVGFGRLWGTLEHTTGAVTNISGGGTVIFNPRVKTEIPLDTYLFSVSDTITFSPKWEARLCLKKSISNESATAEAWERGIYYAQISWWPDPDSLDIKWDADSELDALSIELKVNYNILTYSGFSLSAGLGYIREQLEVDVNNMVYYTPSLDDFLGVNSGAQPVPRMLRQFSFTCDIPYMEIITAYRLNNRIGFSAGIGYAPFITVENSATPMPIDDSFDGYFHVDGKGDGHAIMASIEAEYNFYENWIAIFKTEYMKTDTNGSENRYYSGLWALDVEHDIESEEIYLSLEAAYVF